MCGAELVPHGLGLVGQHPPSVWPTSPRGSADRLRRRHRAPLLDRKQWRERRFCSWSRAAVSRRYRSAFRFATMPRCQPGCAPSGSRATASSTRAPTGRPKGHDRRGVSSSPGRLGTGGRDGRDGRARVGDHSARSGSDSVTTLPSWGRRAARATSTTMAP